MTKKEELEQKLKSQTEKLAGMTKAKSSQRYYKGQRVTSFALNKLQGEIVSTKQSLSKLSRKDKSTKPEHKVKDVNVAEGTTVKASKKGTVKNDPKVKDENTQDKTNGNGTEANDNEGAGI
jgi:hypothetical protein